MHTSYLGPILHHGYYTMYYCIRTKGWFTRLEANQEVQGYDGPPGLCSPLLQPREFKYVAARHPSLLTGFSVPTFRDYIEKGAKHGLPHTDGKLHFTASQARHWTEHSIVILERLFARKVGSSLRSPLAPSPLALSPLAPPIVAASAIAARAVARASQSVRCCARFNCARTRRRRE